jgi:predicted nucleic acid-binding protein
MRVLIDTNVILDFVLNRVPFADGAATLLKDFLSAVDILGLIKQ